MWPMQSARTFPSRLNSISSARSDYDQWSRFSEIDSTYEYAYDDDPPLSPTEDLGSLVRDSQQALNVLRNANDAESCFNFDDPDGASDWGDGWTDYAGSVAGFSRRPSRRYGSVASRYTARSALGRPRPGGAEHQGRSPYGQQPAARGLLSPGSAPPPAHLARMPSARHARMPSTRSTRPNGPNAPNTRGSRLGAAMAVQRNGSLLRRATTRRRANLGKPLPPTREAAEDNDFEASLARLSAASVFELSPPSVPNPHSSVNSLSLLLPGAHQSVVSQSSTSQYSVASPPGPSPQAQYQAFRPGALETAVVRDEKPQDQLPEWQESRAERAVTFQNVRLGTESSVASLISLAEKPAAPYTPTASPPPEKDEESVAVSGLRLAAVTLALSLAVFVVGMDVNIISTAIPHITQDFNALDDIGWYGSAFLMTTCAFQVLFGRIYTLFSAKWVFMAALAIFEVGSLLCALAPNSYVFIVGRAVQGVGTSGILSGALIIGALIVPLSKRALLGGVIGAMEGVAMISAPLIGGFFTDRLTWRWCFYINLPIGAVVIGVVLLVLRVPPQKSEHVMQLKGIPWLAKAAYLAVHLDLLGMLLLIPAIVSVLLGLQWGGTKYPWSHLGIILLFVLAAVLLAVFCYFQHQKQDMAMVPPRILKQRTILAGFWFMLCTSSALVVMAYFVSAALGVSRDWR